MKIVLYGYCLNHFNVVVVSSFEQCIKKENKKVVSMAFHWDIEAWNFHIMHNSRDNFNNLIIIMSFASLWIFHEGLIAFNYQRKKKRRIVTLWHLFWGQIKQEVDSKIKYISLNNNLFIVTSSCNWWRKIKSLAIWWVALKFSISNNSKHK